LVAGGDDGRVRIWDLAAYHQVGRTMRAGKGAVHALALSPNGKLLLSGADDGTARIWKLANQQAVTTLAPLIAHSAVKAAAWSPTGRALAVGGRDIHLLNLATRRELVLHPVQAVQALAFSPDGKRIVSGEVGGSLQRWDVSSGRAVGAPMLGHTRTVESVAYSPDGRSIASGADDNSIRVWNADTGKRAGPALTGHTSAVLSVAWSHDSRILVSGGLDQTIRMWDVASGQQISNSLRGTNAAVTSVALSPDSSRIYYGSANRTLGVARGIFWHGIADLRRRVCALVSPGLTAADWGRYVRAIPIPYAPPCR
jgi:WD40 repeat protein